MTVRPTVLVRFSEVHSEETDILHGVRSYADEHKLDWDVNSAAGLDRHWRLERLDKLGPNDLYLGRKSGLESFQSLLDRGVRWVDWAPEGSDSQADAIASFDASAIGRVAFDHLCQVGAKTFAFQGPDLSRMPQRNARHHAFRVAAEASGMSCHVIWEKFAPPKEHQEELQAFCQSHPQPIGFFFYHDIQADRFLHSLVQAGIKVPSQAMVVGGSSSAVSELLQFPITSVRLPFIGLGRAMAKQAHLLLSGSRPEPLLVAPASVIARDSTAIKAQHQDPVIKRIQNWIQKGKRPIPTVNEICERYELHRNVLAQLFRKAFQQSPKQWLMEHAMQRASDLLAESNQSIDEVAKQCGFAHRSNFSQRFQNRFGIAPAAYRSQFR